MACCVVARGRLPRGGGREPVTVRGGGSGRPRTIAGFALRKRCAPRLRGRRLLTVAFLVLYGLGTWQAFAERRRDRRSDNGIEGRNPLAGATLTCSACPMFATLFLGAILAVFLTLGAVRGDAERGLLQPLLVRPPAPRDVPARPLRGRGGRVRPPTSSWCSWPAPGDHRRPGQLVARPHRGARARAGRRRGRARPRSRSPGRSSSPARRTGSPCSCSSAPA